MDNIQFLWGGYESILRTVIVGTLAYISLVFIIRISGKRTLATMNAFDFVITVAIGAAFGRVLTAKNVAISEAVTAFILLAFLQFVFSYIEFRSSFFRKLTSSPPKMLYYKGEFVDKNLRSERINKFDLMGSVRKKGYSSLDDVEVIILESDGSFSVLEKSGSTENSSFENMINMKEKKLD